MKKRFLILPLLASLSLCGCDLFKKKGSNAEEEEEEVFDIIPEFASGTEDEKLAILRALNQKAPAIDNDNNTAYPDVTLKLKEDEGDYLILSNKILVDVNGSEKEVSFEWSIENESTAVEEKYDFDDHVHTKVCPKFPGYGNADTEFKWSISKITCGSAVTSDTKASYTASIKATPHYYQPKTIEEIYEFGGALDHTYGGTNYHFNSTSALIDYTRTYTDSKGEHYEPGWKVYDKETDSFLYVQTQGKVTYLTPDGKWGLITDGTRTIEIFAGSGDLFLEQNWPKLKVGEYVNIMSEVGSYYGNLQLSFVVKVWTWTDHPEIATPEHEELSLSRLTANEHLQFTDGLTPNLMMYVTGNIKANSIKGAGKTKSNERFTFTITLGSGDGAKELIVSYDYHTQQDSDKVWDTLLAKYNAGGSITLKGSMRFAHSEEKKVIDLKKGNQGTWSITPIHASEIA